MSIPYPQRNNRYTLSEIILALIYPMILGLEKIEVSALLKTNGVFQYITGLPSFPDPTTLRRFLTEPRRNFWLVFIKLTMTCANIFWFNPFLVPVTGLT
jgi:hypothetical protein